jgi:biopolymer transport protein ExbB
MDRVTLRPSEARSPVNSRLLQFHGKYAVLSIIKAAGWPIWPIILCSVVALAIIGERLWSLRASLVAPKGFLNDTVKRFQAGGVTQELINQLANGPAVGRIFAAALVNVRASREVMKDAVEDAGRAVLVDLERFVSALGTIATAAPLLGLFGTVVGMIEIFASQSAAGTNPAQLAQGISIALYNTAFGLAVAIPALIAYRHFRNKIDVLVVEMEQQAIQLIEVVQGERKV